MLTTLGFVGKVFTYIYDVWEKAYIKMLIDPAHHTKLILNRYKIVEYIVHHPE